MNKKAMRRITPKPPPKRDEVLFTRIKGVNKRFLEKQSRKEGQNLSEFTDALIEKERLKDAK